MNSYLYVMCVISFAHRHFILGYKADIICLQEVDGKVFDADLKPIFSSLGFEAEFSKKGGQVSEGMACLFNTSKFRLIESFSHRSTLGSKFA